MRSISAGTLVVLLAVLVWQAWADDKKDKPKEADKGGALARHGEYLVTRVSMCVDCHTPRNAKGKLDTTRHLQGGPLTVKPVKETGHWAEKAPDITRGGLAG